MICFCCFAYYLFFALRLCFFHKIRVLCHFSLSLSLLPSTLFSLLYIFSLLSFFSTSYTPLLHYTSCLTDMHYKYLPYLLTYYLHTDPHFPYYFIHTDSVRAHPIVVQDTVPDGVRDGCPNTPQTPHLSHHFSSREGCRGHSEYLPGCRSRVPDDHRHSDC